MIRLLALLFIIVNFITPNLVRGDSADGFDSPLAQAVRSATSRYRLVVWAVQDGYVQTTGYIPQFGTMYTNHARFDSQSLADPTVLVYDLAGRLVACGYQYLSKGSIPQPLRGDAVTGWYQIPRHVHYNISVGGVTYYAQQAWDGDAQPTAAELIKRKLMPPDGTLIFAFVHPASTAILIWAWSPDSDGLFSSDNPSLP